MDIKLLDIERLPTNDLAASFVMRYRLESDPDEEASYTTVATTKTFGSVILPHLDISTLPDGIYVLHTYYSFSGIASGTIVTFQVGEVSEV